MKLTPTLTISAHGEHALVHVRNTRNPLMRRLATIRDTPVDAVADALRGHTNSVPGTTHVDRCIRIVARLVEVFGDNVRSTYREGIGLTKSEYAKLKNARRAAKRRATS